MAVDFTPRKLFEQFGVEMSIMIGGGMHEYFKGFLQPLRYKNKIYLSGIPTEIGYDNLRKYLLVAPPEVRLDLVDGNSYILMFDQAKFSVDHCEQVYFKEKPFYFWAIVSKEA
ncbi:MAG: hypothetical protein UHM85_11315 [Acutalibacteraceae bacterium]|nr:hypothetical protein [Acutalibacteraceae bacterium]